jgi:hypothetical protein
VSAGSLRKREGVQIVAERILARSLRPHADVGGDPRQDLIARDEHARVLREQARVLRGMSARGDDAPAPSADADCLAVGDRHELKG